jgi:antirestriction protein ArdC
MNPTYNKVTSKILNAMTTDKVLAWHKPWKVLGYMNAMHRKLYRGVNVLMLSLLGEGENLFLTFKQVNELGGKCEKGTGIPIVFWKGNSKEQIQERKDKGLPVGYGFHKMYWVFPVNKTGCTVKREELPGKDLASDTQADSLVDTCGVTITFGGNVASSSKIGIHMPNKAQFTSLEQYYGVLFHEIGHSLGHELDRKNQSGNYFGSEKYSFEELVAEIFSNFALSFCGMDSTNAFDNSIAYFQSWIKVLDKNPDWIVKASAKAQKRFDLLLQKANLTPTEATNQAN